jgi:hypothetical protein
MRIVSNSEWHGCILGEKWRKGNLLGCFAWLAARKQLLTPALSSLEEERENLLFCGYQG